MNSQNASSSCLLLGHVCCMCAVAPGPGTARAAGAVRAQSLAQRAGPDSGALVCSAQTILRQYRHPIHSSALGSCSARIQIQMQIFIYESKDNPYQGDLNTLLKAHSSRQILGARLVYRSWIHLVFTLGVSVRGGASSEA